MLLGILLVVFLRLVGLFLFSALALGVCKLTFEKGNWSKVLVSWAGMSVFLAAAPLLFIPSSTYNEISLQTAKIAVSKSSFESTVILLSMEEKDISSGIKAHGNPKFSSTSFDVRRMRSRSTYSQTMFSFYLFVTLISSFLFVVSFRQPLPPDVHETTSKELRARKITTPDINVKNAQTNLPVWRSDLFLLFAVFFLSFVLGLFQPLYSTHNFLVTTLVLSTWKILLAHFCILLLLRQWTFKSL